MIKEKDKTAPKKTNSQLSPSPSSTPLSPLTKNYTCLLDLHLVQNLQTLENPQHES
jgi:hypothetical protein